MAGIYGDQSHVRVSYPLPKSTVITEEIKWAA